MVARWTSIPAMARTSAARWGDRPAVADGEVRWSFADVEREMLAVARSLLAMGVEPGDRIGLWAPNSAAWIPVALGIQAVGAWLVPLNTRLKGEEAAYILGTTDARVLFAPRAFLGVDYVEALRDVDPDLRALSAAVEMPGPGEAGGPAWEGFLALGDAVDHDSVVARLDAVGADDVSDIIFTSGTTGRPKGVMLRHGTSLEGYASLNTGYQLAEGDRYLVPTPFFHCFGYKAGWMLALMSGALTVPVAVFDAEAVLGAIEREGITYLPGSPTMFSAILDHPRRAQHDLSSLRCSMVSAATVPAPLVRRMRAELELERVFTGYGLTENHALVAFTLPDDPPEVVATCVGKLIPGLEARIVGDDGRDVARGQQGEIWVRGGLRMSGYYGDPDATAATIVDGWLHTGDIGVLDERDYLKITDRKKDMFIVGGFNVAPAEVERVLLGLDGVAQVAVVGAPDDHFGEVGVAFVIPAPGATVGADEVEAYAREHLANYKVPRRVIIIDAFPLNATGKVLKTELRRMLAASTAVPRASTVPQ